MANKIAAYRNKQLLEVIERWWHERSKWTDKPCNDITSLFMEYTEDRLESWCWDDIITLEDFVKCLYKLGIRNITTPPARPLYQQAGTYRPTDTLTQRFDTSEWTEA